MIAKMPHCGTRPLPRPVCKTLPKLPHAHKHPHIGPKRPAPRCPAPSNKIVEAGIKPLPGFPHLPKFPKLPKLPSPKLLEGGLLPKLPTPIPNPPVWLKIASK